MAIFKSSNSQFVLTIPGIFPQPLEGVADIEFDWPQSPPETDEIFRKRLQSLPVADTDRPAIAVSSGAELDALAKKYGLRRSLPI